MSPDPAGDRSRLPIVDTHVHLWDKTQPRLRWDWLEPGAAHPVLGDIEAIKAPKFDATALWSEARFAGVTSFVHVQAAIGSDDPVDETRWLTEMSADGGIPGALVAHADLGLPDAMKVVDAHLESPIMRGIRDFATEPYLAAGEVTSDYEAALRGLTERELVLDIDCEWPNMHAAAALARRHPQLKIVLEHLGYPRRRDGQYFGSWSKAVGELGREENVVCKISGIGMTDHLFTPERLEPWAHRCLEAFGPQRCVVGSNWPVDRIASSYDVIMDLYRTFVAALNDTEQAAVLAGNAQRVYRV
jgi:predicted TIM-barrel fold metal-dependent hydrolase